MPHTPALLFLMHLPRPLKRFLVMFCDVVICGFSVWLAFGLRLDRWDYIQSEHLILLIFSLGIAFPIFISFGLYRAIFRYIGSAAFLSIIRAFSIYTILFFIAFTIIGVSNVPRSIGIIQPILLFIGVGASRYLARHVFGRANKADHNISRKKSIGLIYGAGKLGSQIAYNLSLNQEMQLKAFVDDDPNLHGGTINGIAIYPSNCLHKLIRQFDITDVLVAIPMIYPERRRHIINSLSDCGVRVRILPKVVDLASGRNMSLIPHDFDMNELLGRAVVPPDIGLLKKNIHNKVVLVTGAGGSIGSELCRQIVKLAPKALILIDCSEYSLYLIYEELKKTIANLGNGSSLISPEQVFSIKLVPYLASVCNESLLSKIFEDHRPFTVFHAAAYKHVPLVEQNPSEGISNNVFGTLSCVRMSLEYEVKNFILISTDKAVRPTNIMGASKRIAELVLQSFANGSSTASQKTTFSMVRFGNVLGSSGSVAVLFSTQIAQGGPITLTHPEVTRYFMTIPEAAQLVIQASSMAAGGDVFILDMGNPVRIYDLATKMVYLSGLMVKDEGHPHGDIELKVTGLRPGEKLYEELLIGNNVQSTAHPRIMKAQEEFLSSSELGQFLESLEIALKTFDSKLIKETIKKIVPSYQPSKDQVDFDCVK